MLFLYIFFRLKSSLKMAGNCVLLSQVLLVSVYTLVISANRFHLFVWTVFSPKMLYMGVEVLLITGFAAVLYTSSFFIWHSDFLLMFFYFIMLFTLIKLTVTSHLSIICYFIIIDQKAPVHSAVKLNVWFVGNQYSKYTCIQNK